MAQAILRLVDGAFMDRSKAPNAVLSQMACAFHNALLSRNEAQIAYLRDPRIMTLQALEKSKTAEAVALEILDTEIRRLASTRATSVIGLKLKASYASTDSKLADSIVGDILQF